MEDTKAAWYARRLSDKQTVWWKRLLPVQAPYRWNMRRQKLGRTLDVGCGIGRNLVSLPPGSVGVDHNAEAVAIARERGLAAFTTDEFFADAGAETRVFDSLLIAHVIEHMDEPSAVALMGDYLPLLAPGGKVFFVCPQERGYDSDPTHVRFTDGDALVRLASAVGLVPEPWFSFPFPRSAGKLFIYNEFCVLAHKPLA